MANLASYGGYKYDCLNTRYEGHVGNRNPILGTGHTSYDEPAYDVEGNKGAGTRGPKHLAHYREWHTAPSSSSTTSPAPFQHAPNPHHSGGQYRTTHARRGSYLNLAKPVNAKDFKEAVGGAAGGKRLYGVGENVNKTGSGGYTHHGTRSKMHVARNVNVNLRKAHPHSNGHGRQSQQPTPGQTFFNSSNPANPANPSNTSHTRQQQKPTHTPAFRGEKNPITGEGHTATDERNMDLDGRVGAGTRGVDGNRSYNPHRNVITGEGLRAYLSKNHSSQKVEDGECDSYAYYKDRWVSGKEMGGSYTPTAQLQWSHQKYEPHAMPKQWNWSN